MSAIESNALFNENEGDGHSAIISDIFFHFFTFSFFGKFILNSGT